jgi:IclR family transcriptional regulator, acetate operon repressor
MARTGKPRSDAASVKAAARTLEVLEAFAAERRTLSLSQLAKLLNMPVSSCHQLVGTLEARGYLYTVGRRKEIYPTGKILGIARAIVAHDPWIGRATPLLQRLRNRTRETVLLGKRQDRHVIYLAVEEGTEAIRFTASVGDRKPLHMSSLGRALLASLDGPARDDLIRELDNRYRTTPLAFDVAEVARELEIGSERGWQIQQGGREFDVMALAVSFEVGGEMFAVGIAGPLQRIAQSKDGLAAALLETRAAIGAMPEMAA